MPEIKESCFKCVHHETCIINREIHVFLEKFAHHLGQFRITRMEAFLASTCKHYERSVKFG